MMKILEIQCLGDFQLLLKFNDGQLGQFDGHLLLKRTGSLLDSLHDEAYFQRVFLDAGALCWPNGLELSPTRVRELCHMEQVAA